MRLTERSPRPVGPAARPVRTGRLIRVVFDTNIIVSALLQPLGPPARAFMFALGGSVQMCLSGGVYAEYEELIRRPRFLRSEEAIDSALRAIREKRIWVRPTQSH
jgi:predicted nucleic acid-binding protein